MLTTAEVTDLIAGVGVKAYDQGNRTTFNLSPSRTPTEFGLEESLDSQPDLTVDLSNCVCMKEWCDIHFCYYVSSHKILNQ